MIVKPCDYKNGRIYPLPPQTVAIQIKVLHRGDPRLLKVAAVGSIMDCLIEEEASQFKPKPAASRSPHSQLVDEGQILVAHRNEPKSFRESLEPRDDSGEVRVVEAAYDMGAMQNPPGPSEQKFQEVVPPERYEFLARRAEELGFSVEELASAIDAWTRSAEDLYHTIKAWRHRLFEGLSFGLMAFCRAQSPRYTLNQIVPASPRADPKDKQVSRHERQAALVRKGMWVLYLIF